MINSGTSSKRTPLSIQPILVHCEGADCKVTDIKFMTVCRAEGCGLLLTGVVTVSPL